MSQKLLKFHIKSDDYFATLATVLSLIRQAPENFKESAKTLDNIVKDLMCLQKGYKIIKK